jgi:hypothetical protein
MSTGADGPHSACLLLEWAYWLKPGRCVTQNDTTGCANPCIRSRRLWISLSSLHLNRSLSAVSRSEVRTIGDSHTLNTDDCLDKHVLNEDEKKTQVYDALAFRYVSYGAIPCLAGYTIYSLLYETHRGWYSFVISTLTSFVYMFGFVSQLSQIFRFSHSCSRPN